jgi:hypothetical protein
MLQKQVNRMNLSNCLQMLQFWQEKDKRRIMEQGQKQIRKKKDLG